MEKLYKDIVSGIIDGKIDKVTGAKIISQLKDAGGPAHGDVAVVGMALQMPNCHNKEEFWEIVSGGLDCVTELSGERRDMVDRYLTESGLMEGSVYQSGAFLDEIDHFDYSVFNMLPNEAKLMDPCQRLFLKTVWHALEDAGLGGDAIHGSKTGVFVGFAESGNYKRMIMDTVPSMLPVAMVGNVAAMLPSRISYLLDLKGPTAVIDTACSSSMVSVYLACQSLANKDSDIAIAGGVKLDIFPIDNENFKVGMESGDSRTRTFDRNASGAGLGEGIAALVLKPLKKAQKDGDNIYAVIKGIAVNQDGSSMSITSPNAAAQSSVIEQAWKKAKIDPETLAFIEAHGTATNLGDPIEINGLSKVFRKYTPKKQFCAIGSVKTNMGHLYECSGMASLIKSILALNKRRIPPSIQFDTPNREIDFSKSPVYVNTRLRRWHSKDIPMRCGVSSFGLSGTNCHAVLEEPPAYTGEQNAQRAGLFVLSSNSRESLRRTAGRYVDYLESADDDALRDICFTAATGREHFAYRLSVVADSREDLREKLSRLVQSDLEDSSSDWHTTARHAVLPGGKEKTEPWQLTPAERTALTKQAQDRLSGIQAGRSANELHGLGQLYVQGASVSWKDFYSGEAFRRVSLPGYAFEKQSCWLQGAKAVKESKTDLDSNRFYAPRWEESPSATGQPDDTGNVLVFRTDDAWPREIKTGLQQSGVNLTEVLFGHDTCKTGEQCYRVGSTQQDYEQLFRILELRKMDRILYLSPAPQEPVSSPEAFDLQVNQSLMGLFHLVRGLQEYSEGCPRQLSVIAETSQAVTGKEAALYPLLAPVLGLLKALPKEYANLQCRGIDTDRETDVKILLKELWQQESDSTVAYRRGTRYRQVFDLVDYDNAPARDFTVRKNGTYLITGGLGGIGLEMAKFLAAKENVNLILTNRSAMPCREDWDELLRQGGDPKLYSRIKAVRALEELGATVLCRQADVSDYHRMEEVVGEATERFGALHGIIHGAGIGHSDLLPNRSMEQFLTLVRPKIHGTWNLERLTEGMPLDFFVMFSSVATVFHTVAQADYIAANAYLDALSGWRNRQGQYTVTVNWTTWKETGMALESPYITDTVFRLLTTQTAVTSLEQVLNKQIPNVLIGTLNTSTTGLSLLRQSKVALSNRLEDLLAALKPKQKISTPAPAGPAAGPAPENATETEACIAGICEQVLGIEGISKDDNFFELGADSIFLMKIQSDIDKAYPGATTITDLFEYSCVRELAAFLNTKAGINPSPEKQTIGQKQDPGHDIAIIGMALRAPNADTLDEFWENIVSGMDSIRSLPEARKKDLDELLTYEGFPPEEIRFNENAYLEDVDRFDPGFFRLSPREAATMDPHQRQFLLAAWSAIEDAGYGGGKLSGTKTGIYLGYAGTLRDLYSRMLYVADDTEGSMLGNMSAMMTGRLSYLLNLKGPSLLLDSNCSSSLLAIESAVKAIRSGEIDYALAGGIKLNLMPLNSNKMRLGIESSNNRTKAFSDDADGSGIGEGVGVVVLKSLAQARRDNDPVYAVIKGAASNQDGKTAGVAAPSSAAQADVIDAALQDAGVNPETITFFETHGTGTSLGDPIEIKGIQTAYERYTAKKQFCAVSSLKTYLGHTSEAAGVLNVIKAVLALKHQKLPASLNFLKPNTKIDFTGSPVYVNTAAKDWRVPEGSPRRCGVSSFGISGTNVHMVLEEAPPRKRQEPDIAEPCLLTLSARSRRSLEALTERMEDYVRRTPDVSLNDLCYTASTGRGHYRYRSAYLFDTRDGLLRLFSEQDRAEAGYYAGDNKIVSDSKASLSPGELPEQQAADLTRRARQLAEETARDSTHLEELCRLYVQGADLNWETFYEGKGAAAINIPPYAFDNVRCWFTVPRKEKEQAAVSENTANFFHTVGYIPEPLDEADCESLDGAVLLLKGKAPFCSELEDILKNSGQTVYTASIGASECTRCAEYDFSFSGAEAGYAALFSALEGKGISTIVHALTLDGSASGPDTPDDFDRQLDFGVMNLFSLAKNIGTVFTGDARLFLLSKNVYDPQGGRTQLRTEHAALYALGKVVNHEYPQIRCRSIDLDDATPPEAVFRDMMHTPQSYLSIYCGSTRFIEEFQSVEMEYVKNQKIKIRKNGVYVITGGTGGIGLAVSEYLSKQNHVHLVLLNRSAFPSREEWDTIGVGDRRHEAIAKIRAIEAAGSTVDCYAVDIADESKLTAVLNRVTEQYGAVHGVVHGAGVAGDGFIALKEREQFLRTLRPKVHGTFALDRVTEAIELDFMVLFSSNTTLFGEHGQGDYTAANAYLDAYAQKRNGAGKKTLVVNWIAWSETGMAKDNNTSVDDLFGSLTNREALRGLRQALDKQLPRVIIGHMNYGSYHLEAMYDAPVRFSDRLTAAVENYREEHAAECTPQQTPVRPAAIRLTGSQDGTYTALQHQLAAIWGTQLGLEEIDLYDNFYEFGGDSILALAMSNEIYKSMKKRITVVDILEYPTIEALAAYLGRQGDAGGDTITIVKAEEMPCYPLSAPQMRMYTMHHADTTKTAYNINIAMTIRGAFELSKFEHVVSRIIDRHESLRTSFENRGGEIVQVIHDRIPFRVEEIPDDRDKSLRELIEGAITPFELGVAPLIRVVVCDRGDEYLLMFELHHIITDGKSMDLFMRDFTLLNRGEALPPPKYQYRDYSQWQQAFAGSAQYLRQEQYWKQVMEAPLPALDLPTDFDRPAVKTFRGQTVKADLEPGTKQLLYSFCTKQNTTRYMVLLSAYYVFLHKYTSQTDFIVGSPVLGRPSSEFDETIGMFVNTLAIRCRPDRSLTFSEFLDQVGVAARQAFSNDSYQFNDLVNLLKLPQDASRTALFDAFFALQNVGNYTGEVSEYTGTLCEFNKGIARFDLALDIFEREQGLELVLEYSTDLFVQKTAERMLSDYTGILEELLSNPGQMIGDVQLKSLEQIKSPSSQQTDDFEEEIVFNF